MSVTTLAAAARRAVIRATAGAMIRQQAKTADHDTQIREIVALRTADKNRGPLQQADFQELAGLMDVDPVVLHAVSDVQAAGSGFDDDGRMSIIVEPHIFSAESFHAFDETNSDVSYPEWIGYAPDALPPMNWHKHPYAMTMDERWALWTWQAQLSFPASCAALRVGRYLTYARDWKDLGFGSAEAVIRRATLGAREQLDLMFRYGRAQGLLPAFKARDWLALARGYNGPVDAEATAAKMVEASRKRARAYG